MPSERSAGTLAFAKLFDANSPSSAMRVACAKLLRDCSIYEPPVPVREILKQLGVDIEYDNTQSNAEAELLMNGERLVIRIPRKALAENWARMRFTLAHECGHVLLIRYLRDPALISSLDESFDSYAELEKLCDVAASELLMPRPMLREAIRERGVTPQGLQQMQEKFAVSRQALTNNLTDILPGTSLFVWKKHARNKSEENEFRVVTKPGRYHPSMSVPWLAEGCTERHISPRMIAKAAERLSHVYEEDVELRMGTRSWRGRGIATFFPSQKHGEKLVYPAFDLPELQVSSNSSREPSPETIYLFVGDRRTSTAAQYLGKFDDE